MAQFLIIPLEVGNAPPKRDFYKRDTKHFDRENFFLDLLSLDWDEILKLDNEDPNLSFREFYTTINRLIDTYMPLRKMTKKEVKLMLKPWITQDILKSMKSRDSILYNYNHTKNENKKEELKQKYKQLKNKITEDTRKSKMKYYHNFFAQNANNIKTTWKGIKNIININTKRKSQPTSLLLNNKLITDPKIVASKFNDYFSSIAEKLQGEIKYFGKDFSHFLKDANPYNLFIKPTSVPEVINNINDLNQNKALGPNSIPTDIFHLIKFSIAQPLVNIINLSFQKGIYIDDLKISRVVPTFKEKGSDLEHVNYRPISLLSNINKIVEKLMHERLYSFLEKNKCIYDLQFGFRKSHSTTHALLDLTEDIRKAIDNNSFSVGVFIDLQKAFDTVDHKILLRKLDHYGVRGTANDWFKSYLSNRKQFVTINGVNSELKSMNYGVPQGSVLGPLLFLIYINDLHSIIKYSTTRHYADDTCLLLNGKSLKQLKKQLNIDLKILTAWLKANKISLNASKTEYLIFRNPKKMLNYDLKLKIDGHRLYPSKYVKYLGLLLDPHLNWNYHIQTLAPKLSRAIGMLAKIRYFVNSDVLRNIYFGIFSSIMSYGSQIWAQFRNQHVKRIIKLNDKAIRTINFAHYEEPASEYYKKSSILKFQDSICVQNFLFVHRNFLNNLPKAIQNSFVYINNDHDQNTRISAKFCVNLPKARTLFYGIHSIKGRASRNFNHLQVSLSHQKLHTKSSNVCKNIINKFFIDSY